MYLITRTAKDILQKALEEHEIEKEDDKPADEERPPFRNAVSMPDIAAQAVFKPLLRIETDDAKDGHKL